MTFVKIDTVARSIVTPALLSEGAVIGFRVLE